MNTELNNIAKKEKAAVAISIIWSIFAFIISAFISSDSNQGIIFFLASFMITTTPIWMYWIGFWVWGSGYIIRFSRFVIINPIRNLIVFVRDVSITFWYGVVAFVVSYFLSSYFIKSSEALGIIAGEALGSSIGIIIICKIISNYTKYKIGDKWFKIIFLSIFLVVAPYKAYQSNRDDKIEAEKIVKELSNLAELPVANENDSKYLKFIKLVKIERYNKSKEIINLMEELYPNNLDKLLDPETLQNQETINQYLVNIEEKLSLVDTTKSKTSSLFVALSNKVLSIANSNYLSKGYVDNFMLQFNNGLMQNKPLSIENIDLIEKELFLFKEILLFFKERQGRFIYKDNQYLFNSTKEAELYNSYIKRLTFYNEEESKIQKAFDEIESKRQEKLKQASENFLK